MHRKLRHTLRLLIAFTKRYGKLLLSGILLGALSFWIYPRIQMKLPKFRKTETIGLIGKFDQSNIPQSILRKISIGLTQIDEQEKPYPGISRQWKTTNKGKTWTFNLDPQITWSDGTSIKSSEITYNFKDVKITYPTDNQITFQLQDPFSPFPNVLSAPILNKQSLGIGPYRFKKIKRIGNYLKSITLSPTHKQSILPNLKYIFYGTEESAKTAFKLGEIDKLIELLNVQEFKNWPNLTITENQHPNRYVGLFFNTKNPNFKEKSARQALAYAIQNKAFSHTRITSPIMKHSWAHNPNVKPYNYDIKRAKKLWGNIKIDGSNPITEIATVPSLLSIAEKIADNWNKFGFPTQVRVVNLIPQDFDALLITQEVPSDPDQYVLWHSTQPTNLTHYQNPKIDKLLEDGRKEINPDKRLEIYQEFQRTLLEDLPVIFLFSPTTYTITRK